MMKVTLFIILTLLCYTKISLAQQSLSDLQRQVDLNPDFANIAKLIEAQLNRNEFETVKPYLSMLEEYAVKDEQVLIGDQLKSRWLLSQNQVCDYLDVMARVKTSQPDLYATMTSRLLAWQQTQAVSVAQLKCFMQRGRSIVLSRGLLRSHSLYLDIKFALDSDRLTEQGQQQLQRLVTSLRHTDLTGFSLLITGHADAQGSEAYNLDLSQRRADAVGRFVKFHLPEFTSQLLSVGMGESAPLVNLPGEHNFALNRRVEFQLQRNKDEVQRGTH